MSNKRIGLDLDLPDFEPRTSAPPTDSAEIRAMAERAGFTARHAPAPPTVPEPPRPAEPVQPFDARSLRRTNRTAKINIAVKQENHGRFWSLVQRLGTTSGEDGLVAMMDALEVHLRASGR